MLCFLQTLRKKIASAMSGKTYMFKHSINFYPLGDGTKRASIYNNNAALLRTDHEENPIRLENVFQVHKLSHAPVPEQAAIQLLRAVLSSKARPSPSRTLSASEQSSQLHFRTG